MENKMDEWENFDETVGLRIRKIRDNLNWSRERLAEESSVSRTTVYNVENGKRGMTAETLAKICLALNVPPEFILYGTEDKKMLKSQRERIKANLQESIDILNEE